MSTDLAAALVAFGGTLIVLVWNIIDRSRSAFDDRMSQAVEFLTGKTQRRSAGVAIIEGSQKRLIRSNRAWRMALTGLLCAQAVYLLNSSGQDERSDEILNLGRIMDLLSIFQDHSSDQASLDGVINALSREEEPHQEYRGLRRSTIQEMFGKDVISEWIGALNPESKQSG